MAVAWAAMYNGSVVAESTQLNPEKAVELALGHSKTLAGASATISSRELELQAAKRGGFPTLSAALSTQYGSGEPYSFFFVNQVRDPEDVVRVQRKTSATGGFAQGSVTMTVPIYKKGSLFNIDAPEVEKAEGAAKKAEADSQILSDQVTIEVLEYYLGALKAADEADIHQRTHESQSKWLDYLRKRGQEGLVIKSEELAVETALATGISNLNIARRSQELNLLKLKMMLGTEQAKQIELAQMPEQFANVPPVEDILNHAISINGAVKSQEAALQVAKAELRDAKGELLPTLTLTSSAIAASNMVDKDIPGFYSFGLNLAIPIYDFGQKSLKQDAKEAAVIENDHKLGAAKETLIYKIHGAYNDYQDAKEKIEVDKKKIAHAELVGEESKDSYEKGFVGLDQVLENESKLLEAKLGLVQDRYMAWAHYYDVIIFTGKFLAAS